MRRRRARISWLVSLAAVLALAAWVRVANYRAVLGTGELEPQLDGDSSYHLHRIEETLRHFPRVPHFDPDMNWPRGAFCPWADGFDASAAAFALLAGGGNPLQRRIAIALWPAILGVLATWAAIRLTTTVRPGASWRGAALAAGLVTALVPNLLKNSSFGRIDHHVVEALALTLLATWALKRFPGHPAEPPPAPWRFELEGALVSGLAVWSFSGSPIYVAVAAIPLAWGAFHHGRVGGSGGPGLLAGGLLSAILSLPAILDHRLLISFKLPSLFQPLLLAAAGLGISALALTAGPGAPSRRGQLLRSTGLLLLLVLAVMGLAPRAVGEVQAAVTGWLLHRDPWLATVAEFRPLLWPESGFDPSNAYQALGWVGLVAPVALAAQAPLLWRRPRGRWLLSLASLAMGLALLQTRFARVMVPFLGAAVGLGLAAALRPLGRRRRWLVAAPVPVLLVALGFSFDQPTRGLLFLRGPTWPTPALDLASELRDQPPPADLPRGVLTNWSLGHQIQAQSGLPVVVNGFGAYLGERDFWAAVEASRGGIEPFDDYLRSNQIGLVVAGTATLGKEETGADDSVSFQGGLLNQHYMASLPLSPLLIAGSAIPNWNVPHLPHLMPRAASRGIVRGLAFPLPFLWSYERVEGVTVRGRAASGLRVVAELKFTERNRPHTYKAYADAGQDGRWSMVLPFPTGLLRPTIRSDARWRVAAAGGRPVEFELPEPLVRTGGALDVGALVGKP